MAVRKLKKINIRWVAIGITAILCLTAVIITLLLVKSYQDQSLAYINNIKQALQNGSEEFEILNSSVIYDGVYIENTPVGGLSLEEAEQKVKENLSSGSGEPYINLTYNDKSWNLSGEALGAQSSLETALKDAWSVGRTGTSSQRLEQIEKVKAEGYHISVTVLADTSLISQTLSQIKAEIDKDAVNASLSFNYNTQSNKPEFTYTEESAGCRLNIETASNEILVAFHQSSQVDYELKPEIIQPEIKLSDIQHDYVRLSKFSTRTSKSNSTVESGRRTNIRISSAAFNNYVWMPGDILSFNQTTGKRTEEKGYETGLFITSDRVYDEITGGGVCQTSTTLFNAAIEAGATEVGKGGPIEITRRYPHSWPSTYVAAGRDASVNWPSADLVMRNNRTTPLFIRAYFENYTVTFEIWGVPQENDAQYEIEVVLVSETEAPPQEYVIDTAHKYVSKPGEYKVVSESRKGYFYETYQIKKVPGQEPVRTLIYTSTYNPIPGKTYYIPAEEGASE